MDLGTNNCRLLIAEPAANGFRVVDGFSQVVRLGEGMQESGRIGEAAMGRTLRALRECVARITARPIAATACVATQACRAAANGAEFLARVRDEIGLAFRIIDPEEEARLAVKGCASLIDRNAEAALIVDIGGGSTELSWVDAQGAIQSWTSTPLGVATLAERLPEPDSGVREWYKILVEHVIAQLPIVDEAGEARRAMLRDGRAHIIGTSGTVTGLAGVHLNLPRYQRARVDAAWMRSADCTATTGRLRAMSKAERAAHPCIGKDRADFVLPGCAILEAVLSVWPSERLRVADRGLREGLLMNLMAAHQAEVA
ncbi:MAG: Ppx/GppA phosphatase family protein [Hyphomonadaceae bacterium]